LGGPQPGIEFLAPFPQLYERSCSLLADDAVQLRRPCSIAAIAAFISASLARAQSSNACMPVYAAISNLRVACLTQRSRT
jgi:hypothetical protein